MIRTRRWFISAVLAVTLVVAGFATDIAAGRERRCCSLALKREQAEQQWLADKYGEYLPGSDYPLRAGSVKELQENVIRAFNTMQPQADAGGGARKAQRTMGIRWWTESCDKVFFVQDARGENVLGPDGEPVVEKYDRKRLEGTYCKEILDFMETHEEHHRNTCLQSWTNAREAAGRKVGPQPKPRTKASRKAHQEAVQKAALELVETEWESVEFVAADEVEAHKAGVLFLNEATLNALKRESRPRKETEPACTDQ